MLQPSDPMDPAAPVKTFRVRLIRFDRPESQTFAIQSHSEAAARTAAQIRAGREWRVARIERP